MGNRASLFGYYTFLKELHRDPKDLDDYTDGLQALNTQAKIDELMRERAKAK
jgi:hypothetical protein